MNRMNHMSRMNRMNGMKKDGALQSLFIAAFIQAFMGMRHETLKIAQH